LEAIRILLAYACAHNIKLYQIDVKSAFLNGYIQEEVYVKQPPSFEDDKKPNHVYKLRKALYALKQAPRVWYERLRDFLLSKGFVMGKVDITLFTKKIGKDLFVLQIYVDDIIFGSTNKDFYNEFESMMAKEFEMSMIGELSFFLGLQIKQMKEATFVSQTKYIKDMLKKFGMEDTKGITTPMSTSGTRVATWWIKSYIDQCKVQMARGGVNSLFKNLQASLDNHVSIKDGYANSSTSSTTLCKPPIQF
jgi:hypothetical protein